MTHMPTVSIAIPLFNKAAYIVDTVKSVFLQSFADFEIIVVDDGSTDNGAATLRQFDDIRLRVVRQDNAGPAAARNFAIQLASAPFIAFLDADDIWMPDHLLHLIAMTEQFPQAAIFGNSFIDSGTFEVRDRTVAPVVYRLIDDFFSECAFGRAPFYTSSCMVSGKRALDVGGFPIGNYCGEDIALWLKIAADAPVAVSNYIGCRYLRNAASLSFQASYRLAHPICMTVIDTILAQHAEWPNNRKRGAREYYYRLALTQCLDCLRMGDRDAAIKFLDLSAATQAHQRRWWQAKLMTIIPRPLRELAFRLRPGISI
jgi:glycosyltransferase involved in cell wall biosynthesis